MSESCPLCTRVRLIRAGEYPYLVAELPAGYVVLGEFQAWRGYTVLVAKACVAELHQLPPEERRQFLADLTLSAEAVWNAFRPRKLNYEILGNLVPHLHAHVFPRHTDDPDPTRPVWFRFNEAAADDRYRLAGDELERMKDALGREIRRLQG